MVDPKTIASQSTFLPIPSLLQQELRLLWGGCHVRRRTDRHSLHRGAREVSKPTTCDRLGVAVVVILVAADFLVIVGVVDAVVVWCRGSLEEIFSVQG